jgi:N-acetyl-alpha-D-muramate 1-phosphate uridylyltransferase
VTSGRPAGIALAAGSGTRLRPLTDLRPKALCPVGGRPLVELALGRLGPLTGLGSANLAVNAHHHAGQLLAHFGDGQHRVHLQPEIGHALGTAGAVAALRPWLDGRPAVVTNADSYLPGGLAGFLDGWDGERCRLLCTPTTGGGDFTGADGVGLRYVGACLLPWRRIEELPVTPCGLYEVLWRADAEAGALDLIRLAPGAVAIDCGTTADYLAANLDASGGESVVGAGATVLGRLERSVVWDGAWVGPDEVLVEQIRAGDHRHPLTVTP